MTLSRLLLCGEYLCAILVAHRLRAKELANAIWAKRVEVVEEGHPLSDDAREKIGDMPV